jgi:hypothetical protein
LAVDVAFIDMWFLLWPIWHKIAVVAWVVGAALLVVIIVIWLSRG